ncbi:hypothetical protein JYU20_00610 [Bacteroidales bacterium AH-315-I05]|nr:hypothetical protein [Bacteroidales bacterium AH-315-I05]
MSNGKTLNMSPCFETGGQFLRPADLTHQVRQMTGSVDFGIQISVNFFYEFKSKQDYIEFNGIKEKDKMPKTPTHLEVVKK